MPIAVAAMVGPADVRVRKGFGLLTCVGLRTGACLCLFDQETGVAGMVHVTHGESTEENPNRPGKYAGSGVEALIMSMERTGAHRGRLVAVLAGGSEVSVNDGADDVIQLEAGVCRAVQLELGRHGIPILGSDLGGREDRSVILDLGAKTVRVRSQEDEKLICDLRQTAAASLQAA
jgi:chemotaxis protein CheD